MKASPTTPRERPILFSGPLVRALLRDVDPKTVTRRLIRDEWFRCLDPEDPEDMPNILAQCPHGVAGDRLWVRETWQMFDPEKDSIPTERLGPRAPHSGVENTRKIGWRACYAADGPLVHPVHGPARWRPSIHMPRWASRITLEIVSVRVERLQDITADEVKAEGLDVPDVDYSVGDSPFALEAEREAYARELFAKFWDSINGERASWQSNPWVWRVEFKRVETASLRGGQ